MKTEAWPTPETSTAPAQPGWMEFFFRSEERR